MLAAVAIRQTDAVRRCIELLIWNICNISLLMLGDRDRRGRE
jgi:hypothetical protein